MDIYSLNTPFRLISPRSGVRLIWRIVVLVGNGNHVTNIGKSRIVVDYSEKKKISFDLFVQMAWYTNCQFPLSKTYSGSCSSSTSASNLCASRRMAAGANGDITGSRCSKHWILWSEAIVRCREVKWATFP